MLSGFLIKVSETKKKISTGVSIPAFTLITLMMNASSIRELSVSTFMIDRRNTGDTFSLDAVQSSRSRSLCSRWVALKYIVNLQTKLSAQTKSSTFISGSILIVKFSRLLVNSCSLLRKKALIKCTLLRRSTRKKR